MAEREAAIRLQEAQWKATQTAAELAAQQEITAAQLLEELFKAQQREAEEAIKQIGRIGRAIDALPDEKVIRIRIETEGEVPSFQEGGVMPYTGLAFLHAGERVLRSGQNSTATYHGGGLSIGQLVVQGAGDPEATAIAVRDELIRVARRNGLSAFGGLA